MVNEEGMELDQKTRMTCILAVLLGCQGIDGFKVMLPAAMNFGVTPINYCLMTEHIFPDAVIQLNSGLKYLKDHTDDLNLNMDAVFLSGGSAGGNLAGIMANLQTNPEYAEEMEITSALSPEEVKGVVFISALFDNSHGSRVQTDLLSENSSNIIARI